MARSPRLRVLIPLAAIGLVAAFALVGALTGGRRPASPSGAAPGRAAASQVSTGEASVAVPQPASADGSGAKASAGAGAAFSGDVPPATAAAPHYLVRNGDLSLIVARGALLATVDRVTAMTQAMGGYVLSSTIGSGTPGPVQPQAFDAQGVPETGGPLAPTGGGTPYATLTVRVPEASFDAALRRFATLGHVQSVATSSEDVTTQYVDLQARLAHYRAVERRLVRFLASTGTIPQMLAVQDRIDRTQLAVEQLTAQLKAMRETTSYGTLAVYVTEKSAHAAVAATSGSFTGTFWRSLRLIGHGARVSALAATAALPFVVLIGAVVLAAWYVTRRLHRGRRQPTPPTLPA